jgi:predicted Zn-dependent peptidase
MMSRLLVQKALSSLHRRSLTLVSLAAIAMAEGCGGADHPPRSIDKPAIPVADTKARPKAKAVQKEAAPTSGPAKAFRFPKVVSSALPNGVEIATIPSHTLPLVQIRVVVLGGKAADGERPGTARITGQLLKDGGAGTLSSRDLVTKIESLGSKLSIDTGFDNTVLSLAVTRDHLDEAIDLLATVVQKPQFSQIEFDKLKRREIDRTEGLARTSGGWAASMVLYRDLFSLPTDQHPYAAFDATPAELGRITLADCRALHRRLFVPKNTFIVVAGDATPEAVKAATEKAFRSYRGAEPPAISFTDPMPPESLKITVVDRPKSSQSDIYVAGLGPERADKEWAAFTVANQVLGGGASGRLFLDMREKQSLADSARSSVVELAHSPSLLVAYAGTQTAKTGLSLKTLLENMARLGQTAAEEDEVETAKRSLADAFAVKLETIGAAADELLRLRTLTLPDDYDDTYRKELGEVTAALALKIAGEHVRSGHMVVVVAGDAQAIGGMLSHFGQVKVVDPTKNFDRVRTLPMNAEAPLERGRDSGR